MTYFEMKDEMRFQIKFKVYDKQVKNHLLIAGSSNPNLLATCLHELQKNPTKEKYVQKFKHLFYCQITTFGLKKYFKIIFRSKRILFDCVNDV